jgi:hypothetical protein
MHVDSEDSHPWPCRKPAGHRHATSDHLARFVQTLSPALDVAGLERAGALVMRDAVTMLDTFMVDDMPDPGLFERQISPLLNTLSGRERRTVRAYGEIVDVLCKRGLYGVAGSGLTRN